VSEADKYSWDEWVPEQRLLKLNDAAFSLRRKLLEAQTKKNRSTPPTLSGSGAAMTPTSLPGSAKGKDKVGIAMPAAGKKGESSLLGKKRVRDSGVDTVSSALTSGDLGLSWLIWQEADYMKRPEVKIIIPDILKLQLVDDWENITKHNQVSRAL
jgi:mortality factor 4-like protein 1